MLLDHVGGEPLVLCLEDGLLALFSQLVFHVFGAEGSITRLSAKSPPRLMACIAGLLIDP